VGDIVLILACSVAGIVLGSGGMVFYKNYVRKQKVQSAKAEADAILNRAKNEAQKLDRDSKNRARDFEQKARKNVEQDINRQKQTLSQQEKSFKDKERSLD